MTGILARLAVLDFLALGATFAVGMLYWVRGGVRDPGESVHLLHFYLGLLTVLATLALHCLIFIYFLGTGRWVKEVAGAYGIADDPLPKLTRDLKRRTFPVALAAMLVPIAAAAAGTAAQRQEWHWTIHFGLAVLTLLVNAWAFGVEYRNVRINGRIIEDVMREVDRIRAERGLPSNAEALEQE